MKRKLLAWISVLCLLLMMVVSVPGTLAMDVTGGDDFGQIPDDYTEDDYEYDSDIINNMYDVIVNGR